MKSKLEEIKRDPEILLEQCVRYFHRIYSRVPPEARAEWLGKLKEIVNKGLGSGTGMASLAFIWLSFS